VLAQSRVHCRQGHRSPKKNGWNTSHSTSISGNDTNKMEPLQRPWDILESMLSEQRRNRMIQAASQRTYKIRLVLQDTYHPHNVSACMRTAEALGVQVIDYVGLRSQPRATGVSRGVERWLTINRHRSINGCGEELKKNGFYIVGATAREFSPRTPSLRLEEIPLDRPIALVFGNEKDGIHDDWLTYLDSTVTIPMVGLVESLNISVSAAIALHYLTARLRITCGSQFGVTSDEQAILLDTWICRHFPHWQGLIRRLQTVPSSGPGASPI
jgi:tRNA (guanosine-2'-O-)-methyltransferase